MAHTPAHTLRRDAVVRWDQQDAEVTAQLPVRAVLSIAGLSWQDVEARLASTNTTTKGASGAR